MKTLNQFIIERLKLNKDSKIPELIPTEFSDDIIFTEQEINMIQGCACQMKIKPSILTNYALVNNKLIDYSNYIFIHFSEKYDKETQHNFINIYKNPNNFKVTVMAIIDDIYMNEICENKDLEIACKIILNYLDKNHDFYNKIRKIKK